MIVVPSSRASTAGPVPAPHARGDIATPDLATLGLSEEEFTTFRAWNDLEPEGFVHPAALASTAPTAARDEAAWLGRYCVVPGCGAPAPAPIANAASFAGVVFVAGWLSRRRGDRGG